MGKPNKRLVQARDDGKWEVRKPGAKRASAITPTQSDGIKRGREILSGDGVASSKSGRGEGRSVSKTLSLQVTILGLLRDKRC
ncbi:MULTISPECIES: DUF2188 domain-containing protein [Micrococcales]|uniref:DUF2188 domain-containing protein n=2 Tax=Micrococcales TaxID=85006 RepID=A0A1W2BPE9_9MICO|nr:DUF2188 domain-containing protein [Brachybacterium equifaecis]SMC74835.1 hypothetical protein SAMN06296429_108215 [Janibacter indicus]